MAAIGGGGQPRVGRQAQVVVRAEIDLFPAVDDDRGRLRALAAASVPTKLLPPQRGQLVVDPG